MTFVDVVSYLVAGLLALSRILNSTKPYWRFLPTKVAAVVPSVVAMLPVLISAVGASTSGLDLVNALIVSFALLLPGAGVSPDPKPEA